MKRLPKDRSMLFSVLPPRVPAGEIATVTHLIEALCRKHTFSLELAYADGRLTSMIRSPFGSDVRSSAAARLRGYDIGVVSPEDDPMRIRDGETIFTRALAFEGPKLGPIWTLDDALVKEGGQDPLASVIGSLVESVRPDERVVIRVVLRPIGKDWLADESRAGLSDPGGENQRLAEAERREEEPAGRSARFRWAWVVTPVLFVIGAALAAANRDLLASIVAVLLAGGDFQDVAALLPTPGAAQLASILGG